MLNKFRSSIKSAYHVVKAILSNINQPQHYLYLTRILYNYSLDKYVLTFNAIGGNYSVNIAIDDVVLDDGLLNTNLLVALHESLETGKIVEIKS